MCFICIPPLKAYKSIYKTFKSVDYKGMNSLERSEKARWKPSRISTRESGFSRDSRESREHKRPSGLEQGNRDFGISLARKTRQNARKLREKWALSSEPSHPFYRGWEPPPYAGRTRASRMSASSTASESGWDGLASHRARRGRSEA